MWTFLSRDQGVRLGALLSVLLALPYFVPGLSQDQLWNYTNLYQDIPLLGLALILFQYRLGRSGRRAERQFWHLVTASFACWLLNRLLFALVPEESWTLALELTSDVLYLLFYLFLMLAVEVRPHQRRPRDPQLQGRLLELVGSGFFLFALLVYFVLIPSAYNRAAYETALPSLELYLVLDGVILVRFLQLWRRSSSTRWQRVYLWFLVTAALWLLTDWLETLEVAGLIPTITAVSWWNLLWLAPGFTVLLAARVREQEEPEEEGEEPARRPLREGRWSGQLVTFVLLLPALHVGLRVSGILPAGTEHVREVWLLISLLILGLIAILHQRWLGRENLRLESDRRFMLDQLNLAQKMEAVGRLSGGIAHDFNNMLAVIKGHCDLVLRQPLEEAVRSDLLQIVEASERAAALTGSLLTVGQGRVMKPRLLDLNRVLRDMQKLLGRILGEDVELETTLDPDLGPVRVDQGQLEQVILNLVVNARDAMPAGGRLTLSTRGIELEGGGHPCLDSGSYAILSVTDTGTGIDRETQAHIFEPFFTTKEPGVGTGLGLSTAYSIIEQSQGHIEVESAPGEGTTFRIYLPTVEAKARPGPEPRPSLPSPGARASRSETVLLVEDEQTVRQTLCQMLKVLGYNVLEAGDALQALNVFEHHDGHVGAVVTDVIMPEMSGFELADIFAEKDPHIPVLFVSGYAREELSRNRSRSIPADRFVQKPFSTDELGKILERLLHPGPGGEPGRTGDASQISGAPDSPGQEQ